MATMNVKDAAGATVAVEKPLAPGQAAMAASRPVVIASDQTAIPVASHNVTNAGTFAVQATLAAETTKVLGVTRTADGSGNLLTSTSNALDVNIKSGVPAAGITTEANGSPIAFPSDMRVLRTSQDSSTILSGNTSLTPKFKAVAVSTSGNNGLSISAVSKKIRVLAANVTASAAVNFKWRSATAGDLTGLTYCDAAGTGVVLPYNPVGWFETTAGEDLQINLSGAVAVGGHITYVEV